MSNLHILHCHSTFSLGGKEARAVRLMNVFGTAARHTVLSAVPDALGARDAIDPGIIVDFPERAPCLEGKPALSRYRTLAAYMQRFDLILTYNWGSMDAVMTRRMFPNDLPPLIHHEDGFNADETEGLKVKRNLFRRLGLPAAHALVVPSQRLEAIAFDVWKQPKARVHRIANGIDISAYRAKPTVSIPGLRKKPGEVIVGTLAGLRAVKNLPKLVRAAASVPNSRLVICCASTCAGAASPSPKARASRRARGCARAPRKRAAVGARLRPTRITGCTSACPTWLRTAAAANAKRWTPSVRSSATSARA